MEKVGKLFSANEFFESYNWIVLYYTSSYQNLKYRNISIISIDFCTYFLILKLSNFIVFWSFSIYDKRRKTFQIVQARN